MLISWSWHSKGLSCHIAPSLKLFILRSTQAYCHFSECCVRDVCDCSRFPSPWLSSHGDSLTAPTSPSLRLLIPSGSMTGYKPVQVYHHHYIFQALYIGHLFFCFRGSRPLHNIPSITACGQGEYPTICFMASNSCFSEGLIYCLLASQM